MRLEEIERGDTLGVKALIGMISLVSGMRLPDAARVAFYHKQFLDGTLGSWTQATMRGPSEWSISERELMASLTAHWNRGKFCTGAHRAVAGKGMNKATVDAALADYETADIAPRLKAMLGFLHVMTISPDALTAAHVRAVREAGVSQAALADAIAVCTVFNIITRYADALKFELPSEAEFDKAAGMLLKRGYA
jgi:uncharacterized peroxidase-related enzyme